MPLVSRPYKPNPKMCCERCVFGRGEHAPWCASLDHLLERAFRVLDAEAAELLRSDAEAADLVRNCGRLFAVPRS